jgi:hypothetical protein
MTYSAHCQDYMQLITKSDSDRDPSPTRIVTDSESPIYNLPVVGMGSAVHALMSWHGPSHA